MPFVKPWYADRLALDTMDRRLPSIWEAWVRHTTTKHEQTLQRHAYDKNAQGRRHDDRQTNVQIYTYIYIQIIMWM